jgi:hypothetical protein
MMEHARWLSTVIVRQDCFSSLAINNPASGFQRTQPIAIVQAVLDFRLGQDQKTTFWEE